MMLQHDEMRWSGFAHLVSTATFFEISIRNQKNMIKQLTAHRVPPKIFVGLTSFSLGYPKLALNGHFWPKMSLLGEPDHVQ